jgi:uncharacterized protein YecT (DUF1311 family)
MCHSTIVANAPEQAILHRFRTEWVHGHLDTQRAAEALEAAQRAWTRVRDTADASRDIEELRRIQDSVEAAARRLAQVKAVLAEQFDRFCG